MITSPNLNVTGVLTLRVTGRLPPALIFPPAGLRREGPGKLGRASRATGFQR
jgi:hypothetical protein